MDTDMNDEMESENVDSDSQEDSRGYCIELYVKPDGTYSVSGPTYKEQEEETEGQDAESLPDAVKFILQTIKENPVGDNPAEDMEAGFQSGPAGKRPMSHY